MDKLCFAPFEPGIGSERVWTPKVAEARVVKSVPEVAEVGSAGADAWFKSPAIAKLNDLRTRKPARPATRVAVLRDEKFLFIAAECMEPEMSRVSRLVPKGAPKGQVQLVEGALPRLISTDDHVVVQFDARHDKTACYALAVNVNGAARALRLTTSMSWTALPVVDWLELDGLRWESAVAEGKNRWRVAVRIDLASVGVDAEEQPTVGLNIIRGRNVDVQRHSSWADILHPAFVPALAFGDLYLSPRGATVRQIDWGGLEFGANEARLSVVSSKSREVELHARVAAADVGHFAESASKPARLPAGKKAGVRVAFEVPDELTGVLVTLDLIDRATGRSLYRATWPMKSHGAVRLDRPFREAAGAADPSPSDAEFHRKKTRWILSRLPRFRRRTTAEGATSDFTLESVDGTVSFDLMKPGALRRIGAWLSGLFETGDDRLAAAALFTNDDWVTVHAAARTSMQDGLTPLSMLRMGGGHCYSRAVIGAGIVREIIDPASRRSAVASPATRSSAVASSATRKRFEAYPCLVMGHVVTAVRRGKDWVLIDPTFGHFFYDRSNMRLATAAELEADPSLVSRVVKGKARLANYAKVAGQVRIEPGTIVWPAGAPPE